MQEDLRGAESLYADLPGFESQRLRICFAGLRTNYIGHVPLGVAPATYRPRSFGEADTEPHGQMRLNLLRLPSRYQQTGERQALPACARCPKGS